MISSGIITSSLKNKSAKIRKFISKLNPIFAFYEKVISMNKRNFRIQKQKCEKIETKKEVKK
jgi:hypothetical protein